MTVAEQEVFWYLEDNLSPEHRQKLAQMREELEQSGQLLPAATLLADDVTLLRFLKARSWSVHKAVKMYQAMAAWRAEQQLEHIAQESYPELPLVRKFYPQFFHKTDRLGRPVWIELLGSIDVDHMLQVTSIDRFLRHHIQCCESFRTVKLPACSAAAGRPILTQTIILDMQGLSPMKHFTPTVQRFLHTLSTIDQDNFPEHLGCLFMINTPLLFRSFWSVIKGFLDERTLAKIKVLGRDYKSELLAVIAPENLPQQFGGLSPCTELVDVGPWQDPAVVAKVPALRKAAAAGQLHGLAVSTSSDSLTRGSSSLIGAGSSGASDASGEEETACSVDATVVCAEGIACA